MYIKSWYVLQVRRDNQTEWWDAGAPIPIDGDWSTEGRVLDNMAQESAKYSEDEYRIIIRTEQQIA